MKPRATWLHEPISDLHIEAVSCGEQPAVGDEDGPALVLLPPKPEADLPGPLSSSRGAATHDLAEGQSTR